MTRKSVNKSAIRKHCQGLTKNAGRKAAKTLQGKPRFPSSDRDYLKQLNTLLDADIPSSVLRYKLKELFRKYPESMFAMEEQDFKPFTHGPEHFNSFEGRPVERVNLPE